MSLYHAYRPQTFAEIVGQDHIKQTIASAVKRDEVAHAYLFSGPRGIGKTSIARILAAAVNCATRIQASGIRHQASEKKSKSKTKKSNVKGQVSDVGSEPCGTCPNCQAIRSGADLNVIEIDAASNRGIDEIRQLRDSVGFAPSGDGRKVYIIDEVHMLTKEAFNALLKTLEEPPNRSVFILATTELHRVPDTIISRTQHFEFKRATIADTRDHLQRIAKQEKLTLDDEATMLIALHADGAFRDALSLLDQLAALGEKTITAEHVRLLLGIAPEAELLQLLSARFENKPDTVHEKLERFAQHGYDPAALADALMTVLRHTLWAQCGIDGASSDLVKQFIAMHQGSQTTAQLAEQIERLIIAKQQLRWTPLPMLPLELALLPEDTGHMTHDSATQQIRNSNFENRNKSETRKKKSETATVESRAPSATRHSEAVAEESRSSTRKDRDPSPSCRSAQDDRPTPQGFGAASKAQNEKGEMRTVTLENPASTWQNILAIIRPQNAQLAALLKSSRLVSIQDGECKIGVPFRFYADRITNRRSATTVTEAIKQETGAECTIRCELSAQDTVHSSQSAGTKTNQSRTQEDVEKDVIDVFGLETTVN